MLLKRKFDIFLLGIFLIFSVWLMNKSFGYNPETSSFRIARHQIGDFGLHLSLIRSFSWGNNYFPVESPFFPGQALPYHYYFDFVVGFLEKIGFSIDLAFNGVSILIFTFLLYLLYKLPQLIFVRNKLLGILSVLLFVFHSNFTFVDFFREKGISFSILRDLWFLPDYIHKGPFDGSLISIFFTLNVYLNQRHLILAFTISLGIIYLLLSRLMSKQVISTKLLFALGLIFGILSRVHTITFFATAIVLFLLIVFFRRFKLILPLFLPAVFIFSFHAKDILGQDLRHALFIPGFLAQKPLTIFTFISFWFANLGVALILIPISFLLANRKQKLIFLGVLPLFIIGNIFQLSFRIEHNHSLFNFFIIFANFYIAYLLVYIVQRITAVRLGTFLCLLFLLTFSGFIDLMAVKNDFQLYLPDTPTNKFMKWIKSSTKKESIFLSKQEILDPITLSGRKNYLGHNYYLSVMGYNYSDRLDQTKSYFEANSSIVLQKMRTDNISYIVIPKGYVIDFNYIIHQSFFEKNLQKVYEDDSISVYKI